MAAIRRSLAPATACHQPSESRSQSMITPRALFASFAGNLAAIILIAGAFVPCASAATTESEALADCLFENTTSADRDAMVQWAYVSIGKTRAAKAIQAIPSAKTKAVEENAQKVLTTLVMKRCAKPAMKLLLKDPKNGLQDTLGSLAVKLVKDETAKRSSPILSLTITDLLRP